MNCKFVSIFALVSSLLAGCGGGHDGREEMAVLASLAAAEAAKTTTLVRAVENKQCQPPTMTVKLLDKELLDAGIQVRGARCGSDGLGRIAACGEPTVYLRIVDVSEAQAAATRALGYKFPSEFPQVLPADCPE